MAYADVALSISGRPAVSDRTFDRFDPVTGGLVTRAAAATVDDARAAADAAAAALAPWAAVGPTAR
ncbi:MAG TPA: aldehyde dehydrogenase family protein, partial [Sphingomonas sp.]